MTGNPRSASTCATTGFTSAPGSDPAGDRVRATASLPEARRVLDRVPVSDVLVPRGQTMTIPPSIITDCPVM